MAQAQPQPRADVTVQNEGSILVFWLNTPQAQDWVNENCADDVQYWGKNGLVVEHRFAADLAQGMREAGLEVE